MDYNEIIDYNGELIILNSENVEIKPMIKSCQVKQLRHQESIILENYMDTDIQPYFGTKSIPLEVFKKEVFDTNFKEQLDGADGNSPDELWKIFANADLNSDKALDYDEFKTLICSPKSNLKQEQVRYLNRIVRNAANSVQVTRSVRYEKKLLLIQSLQDISQKQSKCKQFIPRHFFILTLSCVQIIIYVVYSNKLQENNPFVFDPQKTHEIWRFFTYMLLHSGYLHLSLNIFVQLLFGLPLEHYLKSWRVAVIFFSGVLIGSFVGLLVASNKKIIGSSAGAYAISFAFFTYIVVNLCEKLLQKVAHFVLLINLVILLEVLFYMASDDYFVFDNHNIYVHLSGAVTGALIGFFFTVNSRKS